MWFPTTRSLSILRDAVLCFPNLRSVIKATYLVRSPRVANHGMDNMGSFMVYVLVAPAYSLLCTNSKMVRCAARPNRRRKLCHV